MHLGELEKKVGKGCPRGLINKAINEIVSDVCCCARVYEVVQYMQMFCFCCAKKI